MSCHGRSEPCRLLCQRQKEALDKKIQKPRQSPAKEKRSSARKSLASQFCSRVTENEDAILNIDDMISSEQSTRVKVVVLWPNGRTDMRVPDRKENITLLKNVAFKNWQAVANGVFQHSELRQDILKALWRKLNAEFKEYWKQMQNTRPIHLHLSVRFIERGK